MSRVLQQRQIPLAQNSRKGDAAPRRSPRGSESRPRKNNSARRVARPQSLPATIPAKDSFTPQRLNSATPQAFIRAATPLSRVLHASTLNAENSGGSNEQFVDQNGDLRADENTIFDHSGGSFDLAVGGSGSRYEVFTALDDRGTNNPNDDTAIGVLVAATDANADYVADFSSTYDLERDFGFPSAVSVVTGINKAGREFVVVSSSGYYNADDPNDPANEPTAGVVLLIRDAQTGGFDPALSRELVRVGDNQLNNANALALLPNNDLLIADFDSNNVRVVRDTNNDGLPDTLDAQAYYSFPYAEDAPLDIAVNSRGVAFSHSYGNSGLLLAIYDDDGDGLADADEIAV
ncbi:MAG TPA: hypothetical protein VM870_01200, partial [Pyrinomonadaceae bacterium]|nr:hypothetical protein [Pyrinomonadaceae bacterium]